MGSISRPSISPKFPREFFSRPAPDSGASLASLEPQQMDPNAVAAATAYLRKRSPDDATAQRTMNAIVSSRLLDTNAVERLVHTSSPIINTDWNRWIEFSTPRYNLSDVDWATLNRRYLASMTLIASSHR
jgi:hypothetical protein